MAVSAMAIIGKLVVSSPCKPSVCVEAVFIDAYRYFLAEFIISEQITSGDDLRIASLP